jgi:hypothetical protein
MEIDGVLKMSKFVMFDDVLHLQNKYLMIEILTLLSILVCYCEVRILYMYSLLYLYTQHS